MDVRGGADMCEVRVGVSVSSMRRKRHTHRVYVMTEARMLRLRTFDTVVYHIHADIWESLCSTVLICVVTNACYCICDPRCG